MDRVIKFKALGSLHRIWVYGMPVNSNVGYQMLSEDTLYHIDGAEWNCNSIDIDEKTICQFTGLFDKNGKEIYEGDIVNIGFGGDRSVSYSEHKSIIVYWDSDRLQFCVKYRNEIVSLVGYHLPKYEIIGNVYEAELTNK